MAKLSMTKSIVLVFVFVFYLFAAVAEEVLKPVCPIFSLFRDESFISNKLSRIMSEDKGLRWTDDLIGESSQGLGIHSYRSSFVLGNESEALNTVNILLVAGLHAREWITIGSASCLLEWMMSLDLGELFGSSSSGNAIKVNLHFIPLANPDGYMHSRKRNLKGQIIPVNRHWRKTFPSGGGRCNGVDMNRNFGYENISWGHGAKDLVQRSINLEKFPCSELYEGNKPFSAPESVALKDYIQNTFLTKTPHSTKMQTFWVLDLHCCAKAVYPSISFEVEGSELVTGTDALSTILSHFLADAMNTGKVQPKYVARERSKTFSKSNTGIFVDWVKSLDNDRSLFPFMLEVSGKPNPRNFKDLFRNNPSDIQPVADETHQVLKAIINLQANDERLRALEDEEIPKSPRSKELVQSSSAVQISSDLKPLRRAEKTVLLTFSWVLILFCFYKGSKPVKARVV